MTLSFNVKATYPNVLMKGSATTNKAKLKRCGLESIHFYRDDSGDGRLQKDGRLLMIQAQFRRRSIHVPNQTVELSTVKERRLDQLVRQFLFGAAKALRSTESVELNLSLTHGALSESDVALVLLQSRTYSIRFGT